MPSKEEIEDILRRNGWARYLHERARTVETEAAAAAEAAATAAEAATTFQADTIAETATIAEVAATPESAATVGAAPTTEAISSPDTTPTINELLRRLFDPPPSVFHRNRRSRNRQAGTVRFTTKILVDLLGEEHFTPQREGYRQILREESKLRTHGLEAGIPEGLYNWMVDDGGPKGEGQKSIERFQYFMPEGLFMEAKKAFKHLEHKG